MQPYSFLFCIIIISVVPASQKTTNLSVHQKVNILKRKIQEQIKHQASELILPIEKLTPVDGMRENDGRLELGETRSTDRMKKGSMQVLERPKNKFKSDVAQQSYRRAFGTPDVAVEWLHCQDLVTPFFLGHKTEVAAPKHLTIQDHAVYRFLQLIQLNTTGLVKEEIYSILYQISHLQLRLFQWDITAVAQLLNIFVEGRDEPCNFRKITYGVRGLMEKWHLDISNTTNLLRQSRIFRPPCVRVSDYEGSTKTSVGVTFTKSPTSKSPCSQRGKC